MTKYFTKEGDEFKEIESFSEQQLDEITGNVPWLNTRLERARANERSKFADYDDLKKKVSSIDELKQTHANELKTVAEKATELEKQLGGAKLEVEKVKVMHEFKLSDDMAEFLTGDNADDIRKRAEKLSKGVGGSKTYLDKEGKPKDGESATDSRAIAGKLFGKKSDD